MLVCAGAAASRANFDFDSRDGIDLRIILHIAVLCVKQQTAHGLQHHFFVLCATGNHWILVLMINRQFRRV